MPAMPATPPNHLLTLPPELILGIITFLPTLSETLNVALCCSRLRELCAENATLIYENVARRSIPCANDAKPLLTLQDGTPPTQISLSTLRRMLRNWRITQKAIARFETEIVSKVRCPAFDTKTIYGSIRRPPTLTRTERIRFVRAYYQLWMLTLTPQADLETRLQNITSIQQLYYLDELCLLNQSIGGEEQATPSQNAESFLKRTDLHSAVWDRLEEVCTAAHDGKEPESVTTYAFEDGYRSFVVLWDHWQDSLKQIVCGIRPGRPWTFDKEELWDDGADVDEALCEEC